MNRFRHPLIFVLALLLVRPVFAHWMGPPRPLEQWNRAAQVVFKGTVVDNPDFPKMAYRQLVIEKSLRLRVVSVLQGQMSEQEIGFRLPMTDGSWDEVSRQWIYQSLPAPVEVGRSYLFWAVRDEKGWRAVPSLTPWEHAGQWPKQENALIGDAKFRCANGDKATGTPEEVTRREWLALTKSQVKADADYALSSLDAFYKKGNPESEEILSRIMELWQSKDENEAAGTVRWIGKLALHNRFEEVLPKLRELALQSPSEKVRYGAIEALQSSRDPQLRAIWLEILAGGKENFYALLQLAHFPSPVNRGIWERYSKSLNASERRGVAEALLIAEPYDDSLLPLIDHLADDVNAGVRTAALVTLRRSKSDKAKPFVAKRVNQKEAE